MNSEDMSDIFEKINNIAGQNNISPEMVNNLFSMFNNSNTNSDNTHSTTDNNYTSQNYNNNSDNQNSSFNTNGIDFETINTLIPTLSCPPGRMDMVKWKTNSIVIDYAHTPDAMEQILKTVRKTTDGNIYTVFGCTGDRDREKRPMMMDIATNYSTKVIVTIDDPHNEDVNQIIDDMLKDNTKTNYEICLDRGKAIEKGINLLKDKDILAILGKGHEEVIIYKDERIPFNDKKKVEEIIKTKETVEI